ncbi:MAG: helix-turn-helix domain-containing protein [Rudaea sp.]
MLPIDATIAPVQSASETVAQLPATADNPVTQLPPESTSVCLEESLGQRLRAAREARGWNVDDVARTLKLPISIVRDLEADQFERIGYGVYLRGYLCKYLQMLELPHLLADRVLHDRAEPPPLTTNGTISHPRYLFERYSGSALYLILTGVIVVPAVLLATRAGFDQNLARVTPLDTPPAATAPASTAIMQAVTSAPPATTQPKTENAPLIASMAPFPASHAAAKPDLPATATAPTANRLHLSLSQASWVEVTDADGRKLEYTLLPAGTTRDYASDLPLDVRIGNADGAAIEIDGNPLDLSAYRHANVARVRIAEGQASPTHGG